MRAVEYSQTGPSAVLTMTERAEPEAGAGEVRVRIHVSGVNPTDWKARAGGSAGTMLAQPQVPNQDGAGEIDQVGEGVTGLRVGDRVWLWDAAYQRADGTAQEVVVLPSRQAVVLPAAASFDVGAAVGIPALTAHRALTVSESGPAQLAPGALRGKHVLIAGGAGAVGHAAIQLAVWSGATVISTVSGAEKAELARRAGAHEVINYRAENVVERINGIAPGGVDVIVEVNPNANLGIDTSVAAPNATIAIYADSSLPEAPVPVRPSMVKNLRLQFVLTYTVPAEAKDAAVRAVSLALADGALAIGDDAGLPLQRFSLAETGAAHDAVQNGFVGKVLIDVSQ
jgi:NADPH2:quinone reductase